MANHRLWAPWRLEYLKGEKPSDCIFCSKPALGDDEQALIVHRGSSCYVILNAFPYTSGHVMVAPYEHSGDLRDLEPDAAAELMSLTQRSLGAIERGLRRRGVQRRRQPWRGCGSGRSRTTCTMHVVPRWKGDTNFMPVVGDTRVLPEALPDTWRKLRDAFAEGAA